MDKFKKIEQTESSMCVQQGALVSVVCVNVWFERKAWQRVQVSGFVVVMGNAAPAAPHRRSVNSLYCPISFSLSHTHTHTHKTEGCTLTPPVTNLQTSH